MMDPTKPANATSSSVPSAEGMPRCSMAIVILNYRTPKMVVDCLQTLAGQLLESERVIVVDNESQDDSVPHIQTAIEVNQWGSWVELREAGGNHGFSAGNNVGIQAIDAEVYFLLNSDTLVCPGAMAELRLALEQNPKAALISPRLEWRDGEPQVSAFREPTPWSELDRAAGTGPISRALCRWSVSPPLSDEPLSFAWASFAAILVRREVFEKIGLMDEGYFLYFEDIDFCRRARLAGFEGLYWPAAHVVHLRGGSGPVKEQQAKRRPLPAYFYASRSRFFAKSYGRTGLLAANVMWLLGRTVSFTREVVSQKKRHLCAKEGRGLWHNFLRPVNPPEVWRGHFPPKS